MKLHDENEPFFITEQVDAELVATGYECKPPSHVRTKSIRELYGWQQGETLQDAMNRHLAKQNGSGQSHERQERPSN